MPLRRRAGGPGGSGSSGPPTRCAHPASPPPPRPRHDQRSGHDRRPGTGETSTTASVRASHGERGGRCGVSVGWAARLLRAVWSLLILTVVTVGIPGLLWRLAGPPL